MSDYESHSGKLRKIVSNENESFDDICKRMWVKEGQLEDTYTEDNLFGSYYEKYIKVEDSLWEIFEHEESDAEDMFFKISDNKDGTYSFHTRFYNGGTYLSEMAEGELKKLSLPLSNANTLPTDEELLKVHIVEEMILEVWKMGMNANETGMPSFDIAKTDGRLKNIIDTITGYW